MATNPNPDRNLDYMMKTWGTNSLATDYGSLAKSQRMLREIVEDDMTPKKHNLKIQKELHQRIRNDDDYDDWEYGTEPIFG